MLCDPGNYAKKNFFFKVILERWRLPVTVLWKFDADYSDSGSSGEEKDDIYSYRRPCIRVGGPDQTVNSDTDNGSQEDDRGKLVFLLKTSKLLLWKGLIYSYIEMEKAV